MFERGLPIADGLTVKDLVLDGILKRGEELIPCDSLHLTDGVDVEVLLSVPFRVPADETDAPRSRRIRTNDNLEKRLRHRDMVRPNLLVLLALEKHRSAYDIDRAVFLRTVPIRKNHNSLSPDVLRIYCHICQAHSNHR